MVFKKLEVFGFKSFPNRTVLNFDPGITTVVGPNGCGKSNIFDAIRWVLGEQSVKALRGSRMEDVIFNGTETKEPLGMAEVSLTFSNEGKIFPIDDKEFVITRRIFRSGESEYLVNKATCRLKDITDLLTGTGVGAESYSLIEQGKIDLILSSRPEDRRMVFDEASGITKYKTQKKETKRKLEETQANLLRLNDIIAEVKRQIAALERQADKARRYKEVFEELKTKEVDLASFQINGILKERHEFCTELEMLDIKVKALQEEYARLQSEHEQKACELRQKEDEVSKAREEVMNLDNLVELNLQHIRLNQERVAELGRQRDGVNQQIGQIKNKISLDKEKIDSFNVEYEQLSGLIEEKNSLIQQKENILSQTLNSIKESQEKINKTKKDILELMAQQTKIKNELIDLNTRLQSFIARAKRSEVEKSKVTEEKSAIEEVLENIQKELSGIESSCNDTRSRCTGIKDSISVENKKIELIKAEIQELENEKISLMSQKEFLENLNLRYQQISESLNVEVLLYKKPERDISGLVVKVKGKVSLDEGDNKSLDTAARQYKLLGEAKPISFDMQELLDKIEKVSLKIDCRKDSLLESENKMVNLTAELKQLEEELRSQELVLADKKSQYNNANVQFSKISEELEIVQMELSQTNQELAKLKEIESETTLRQSAIEKDQKDKEAIVSGLESKIASLDGMREETLIAITQSRTELESLNKRLIRDNETLNMLEANLKSDEATSLEFESQLRDITTKEGLLNSEVETLKEQNAETAEEKEKVLLSQKSFYVELEQLKSDTDKRNLALDSQRNGIEIKKEQSGKIQMRIQEFDFRKLNIKDRIMQGYKVDLTETVMACEGLNEEQASSDIQNLKKKIDSYGTVNLVAIEEYDELKKRYDFLTQQQNDLTTATDALNEAISKINRTAKKMFLDTFKLINEEFRNYFRLLFGGGEASLLLIGEEDPLDSGIEIICRPPGKKLQNISILSGGEKSLSTIALIFAIFKVKPSPFCILDEVDAALDEANVDRYGKLLHEFTKISQFIVITHNKKTIANSDVMYGITMEERGISKIVSVKFNNKKAWEPVAEAEEIVKG